jgi:dTDP-4-dehydrorhamnose reductase
MEMQMRAGDRLLIFGGGGFVGGNLAYQALQRGWQVIAADQDPPGLDHKVILRTVDITNPGAVEQLVRETAPAAVVNCAALANIDIAEREQELAWRVNVSGAQTIAESCASHGIRHIYLSTDAVFDGKKGAYHEADTPNPVNHYGLTKAKGEEKVLDAHPRAAIVRLSLVLGYPVARGNSFLVALEDNLKAGKMIQASSHEIRTPIDILTLCSCILELIGINYSGLLHLGGTESIDRYTLTSIITKALGYPENLVHLQGDSDVQPGRAPRHANGILDISKAKQVLSTPLLNLGETINQALQSRVTNPIGDNEYGKA